MGLRVRGIWSVADVVVGRPRSCGPRSAILARAALCLGAAALASLLLAAAASALSIAPEAAAKYGCEVEKECVMTQPSTPAWLTLSGGETLLTQQSLDGTAANEYGSNAEADTTLYGSAQPYGTHPHSSASVVSATVANLAGTSSATGTYAVVLRSDRTLEVLGPQSSGYPLAVYVTVPEPGSLLGVVALAAPPGSGASQQLIVITSAGFYIYDWAAGSPPTLTLQAGAPTSSLSGEETVGDVSLSENPAVTCPVLPLFGKARPGDCEKSYAGPYTFALPEHSQFLGVYQAPLGKGEFREAVSTFAIAYTGSDLGTLSASESYTVSFFAYEPDGHLHLVDQVQERFAAKSLQPMEVRYATSRNYLRTATLQLIGGGEYTMSSYDALALSYKSPAIVASTTSCAVPSTGGLPALAVDAIESEKGRSTGVSLCAAISGGNVLYQMQRTDHAGEGLASKLQEESSVVSTPPPGSFEAPAGVSPKSIDVTLDLPCDEYLQRFAENPTPDGFPETSGGPDYCAPVDAAGNGKNPMEPLFGAAGVAAAQIQYVGEEAGGKQSLLQESVAYEPEVQKGSFGELLSEPKAPSSQYSERLATLSGSASSGLTMLPLDPQIVTLTGQLVVSKPGEVLRTGATSKPVPIAVMAAPPYYSGAEQQVTPTATTFANSECGGGGTEQSNTVGVFGGVDVDWSEKYEFEALAKVQASWTQSTEIENCASFDQQFIVGNFSNTYIADNSLLFRVDTGVDTYLNLTGDSLGVGVTGGCNVDHLKSCDAIFVPSGSQYALQSMTQLRHPQPNNFYAADDEELHAEYGAALEAELPRPGNPASYPTLTSGAPAGCAGPPSGSGSGNTGIVDVNPFVAPTPKPAPNLLEAPQESEVNPASGGEEGGTSSTLSYDSTKQTTSSAEFSVGAEVSQKIIYAKFGTEYEHAWGSSMTESFQTGTEFTGGVYDFNGFYDPYSYRLYECKSELHTTPAFSGATSVSVPVFLVNYMAGQSADKLPLNFVNPALLQGTVGQEYAGQVFASGGVPGYGYEVASGSLPPGLLLSEKTGEVSGTPSEAGTFTFTVKVHDSVSNTATERDSITINPRLSITSPLPEGDVGQPYEQSLGASGGTPPYTYLLTSSGELPPGLGINNTTGVIEGTPTATGSYCFGVYIADSSFTKGTLESQACVKIGDTLTIDPASLPEAIAGRGYGVTIEGLGGNSADYVYSAAAPASCKSGFTCSSAKPLPEGLSLAASGSKATLSGTPASAGSYEFAIDLSDNSGGHAERVYQLTVAASSTVSTSVAPLFTSVAGATVNVSDHASIAIAASGTPVPVITLTGTLPEGMSFSAGAGGTASIAGTPAPGTTGKYELKLTAQNGVEPIAVQTFTLTVDERPAITTQPLDQTAVAPGGSASFTAAASGDPAPTVAWEESADGGATWLPVPLAVSPTLSLTGLEAADDATMYRAVFTNSQGSVTSNPATLTVDYAPEIASQPADVTAPVGTEASFEAAASGEPAPGAQWQVSTNGGETWAAISGATGDALKISGVTAGDSGNSYRVVFLNSQGTVASQAATLTVQSAPTITSQPHEATVTVGSEASFAAAATGEPSPSIEWKLSTDAGAHWSTIAGATEPTLTVSKVPLSADGDMYEAVFTNAVAAVTTTSATLHVQAPPQITAQPSAETVANGGNATFSASAEGRPAPQVQWQLSSDEGRTWSQIAGATSPSLAILHMTVADSGQLYRAVFTNAAGTATTQPAKLTVESAPGVSVPPSGTVVSLGGEASFSVIVTGSPPPAIQWQVSEKEGGSWTDIPGATSPTLHLSNVTAAQSGFLYRAIITNASGTITTAPVTLVVNAPASAKSAACKGAPPTMPFRNRRLGAVRRYTVFVDGRRVKRVHGRDLRKAKLPRLGPGAHAVRIVAITSKHFRIVTRRIYFSCRHGLAVSKQRHRIKHRHRRRHRRRAHG